MHFCILEGVVSRRQRRQMYLSCFLDAYHNHSPQVSTLLLSFTGLCDLTNHVGRSVLSIQALRVLGRRPSPLPHHRIGILLLKFFTSSKIALLASCFTTCRSSIFDQ